MLYKNSSIIFTGHRNVRITAELKKALAQQLETLIYGGARDFYAGGAVGWDMLCESTVIGLRERFGDIRLHLILPCPAEERTAGWSELYKAEYRRLLSAANTVEVCSEHYFDGCMKVRNRRLADIGDVCICYFNENHRRSGTGQTVRMAVRKNMRIINFYGN